MSQSNLKKVMQFTHVPLMLLIIVKNFLPYTNFLWFIVVFKEESKIFLYLFGKTVFSLLVNGSTLPLHSPLLTAKTLSVHFSSDEIRKIIIELGSNKVHRHDATSICRLETCGESICKPLKLIFKSHLVQKIFLSE